MCPHGPSPGTPVSSNGNNTGKLTGNYCVHTVVDVNPIKVVYNVSPSFHLLTDFKHQPKSTISIIELQQHIH